MSQKPLPVSTVANDIRPIVENKSSTDFGIYYDDHTIYGDLKYVMVKVQAAEQKKTQDNYKESDYKVGTKEEITRPDLFKGELNYAIDRCEEILEKISESDDDFYNLEGMVREHRDLLSRHVQRAEQGELYYI